MTKSIAIVQEERNQPMENFLQFIETYITHLWSVVLIDDLVICRWFLYTAKAWNLSIAIPEIKGYFFGIFASEGTNPRQRRIQWRWRRQKARREVWIGNSSCRQGWVSKKSPVQESHLTIGKEKLCVFILLLGQLLMPWDIGKRFMRKGPCTPRADR